MFFSCAFRNELWDLAPQLCLHMGCLSSASWRGCAVIDQLALSVDDTHVWVGVFSSVPLFEDQRTFCISALMAKRYSTWTNMFAF